MPPKSSKQKFQLRTASKNDPTSAEKTESKTTKNFPTKKKHTLTLDPKKLCETIIRLKKNNHFKTDRCITEKNKYFKLYEIYKINNNPEKALFAKICAQVCLIAVQKADLPPINEWLNAASAAAKSLEIIELLQKDLKELHSNYTAAQFVLNGDNAIGILKLELPPKENVYEKIDFFIRMKLINDKLVKCGVKRSSETSYIEGNLTHLLQVKSIHEALQSQTSPLGFGAGAGAATTDQKSETKSHGIRIDTSMSAGTLLTTGAASKTSPLRAVGSIQAFQNLVIDDEAPDAAPRLIS